MTVVNFRDILGMMNSQRLNRRECQVKAAELKTATGVD